MTTTIIAMIIIITIIKNKGGTKYGETCYLYIYLMSKNKVCGVGKNRKGIDIGVGMSLLSPKNCCTSTTVGQKGQ